MVFSHGRIYPLSSTSRSRISFACNLNSFASDLFLMARGEWGDSLPRRHVCWKRLSLSSMGGRMDTTFAVHWKISASFLHNTFRRAPSASCLLLHMHSRQLCREFSFEFQMGSAGELSSFFLHAHQLGGLALSFNTDAQFENPLESLMGHPAPTGTFWEMRHAFPSKTFSTTSQEFKEFCLQPWECTLEPSWYLLHTWYL